MTDPLSRMLKQESDNVTATPQLRQRIKARIRPSRTLRNRALAISLVVVLLLAGAIGWLVTSDRSVKQGLTKPPPEQSEYFPGYWPVATEAEARATQERVDANGDTWMHDPSEVAGRYASEELGWSLPDEAGVASPVNGSASEGWSTSVEIYPMIGEGQQKIPGPSHVVSLIGLKGAERPVWFVSGIVDENITVTDPKPGSSIASPAEVAGTGLTYEGNIVVTVIDDTGRKLGQQPTTAGGSEPVPFKGSVPYDTPHSETGIVMFEGGSGIEGPNTDVTVVRVNFEKHEEIPGQAVPGRPSDASVANADEALKCFINARHNRDYDAARPCMTDQFAEAMPRNDFMGASSPSLERLVIISSAWDLERVTYTTVMYWGSSKVGAGGVEFLTEDMFTVAFEGDVTLVDAWIRGEQLHPVEATLPVTMHFLALGDTPKCPDGTPTPDSFTTAVRQLPKEAVLQDFVWSVTRETVTGHWAHEPDGAGPFPPGVRVKDVTVSGQNVKVILEGYRSDTGCDYAFVALRDTIRSIPELEQANVEVDLAS
jgi:hypothetical protein